VIAEEYSEAVTRERASSIGARIRALDPVHPIAAHQLSNTPFTFADDPDIEIFDMQLAPEVNTLDLLYQSVLLALPSDFPANLSDDYDARAALHALALVRSTSG
jgi:hypothetical protein